MAGILPSCEPSHKRRLLGAVAAIALLTSLGHGALSPALSQALNDQSNLRAAQAKGRLLVDANEIVYDNEKERVEARGNVQLFYQGRLLEADRVTYDRKTKRVFAEGNAKLTEINGQVIFSDRFELTDDFKDGFIDTLRVVSPDKQRITAARGERTDGETTVFDLGIYTACETCKDNPEKPPLWQVKATRIIAKNSEQLIYFEDARIEFFGLPLAYIPYFSAPDPSVRRKSGLLAPKYSRSSALGFGFSQPFYFALAPNYDVLWTPTAYSRQGLLNEVEFRHRLETGVYNIRAAGIFQADSNAFLPGPYGPNIPRVAQNSFNASGIPDLLTNPVDKRNFRGSLETTGKFLINKNWTFGWDVALTTDKFFLSNYRIRSESLQNNFFKESVSSVYLRGKSDRAYFDLSSYYFQGQTSQDWQKQSAVVHPVLDFNRRFNPESIGGEVTFDLNAVSLSREQADFSALPPASQRFASQDAGPIGPGSRFFGPPSLFLHNLNGVTRGSFLGCTVYQRGDCLLRGIGGNANRVSGTLSWRRTFIDPLGQVWTPFVNAQTDVINYTLNGSNSGFGASPTTYSNSNQAGYLSASETTVRATPTAGLEYRYPLIAVTSGATHLFEPIAQIIASPNEQKIGRLPNEDSQSLVFSDSNLFSQNRFSGYDRVEGGIRSNVGLQYTATFNNGGYVNALAGQSYHLAGRNSFQGIGRSTDLLNTGANSGLDKSQSDYVARLAIAPVKNISFQARGRFDDESLKLKRLDLLARATTGPLTTSLLYSRQDAQPDLGFVRRREGVNISSTLKLPQNWYVSGSVLVDLDRYLLDRDIFVSAAPGSLPNFNKSPLRPSSVSLGVGYIDECTNFSVLFSRTNSDIVGTTKVTGTTVFFRLELKHLGQANYRQNIGNAAAVDGVR
ncbi:MAG: LPS-assembly protein LptD [Beijerinckiaceae bacterium]